MRKRRKVLPSKIKKRENEKPAREKRFLGKFTGTYSKSQFDLFMNARSQVSRTKERREGGRGLAK